MIFRIILLCILFTITANQANGQFTDDFSDGNFTQNPEWTGDTGIFEVLDGQLHLTDTIESTAYLSTAVNTQGQTTWEFFTFLDFAPSGSNFAEVYIKSNSPNLKEDLNGFFVRIGGSNDDVSLYKQTGGSTSSIIDGVDGLVADDPMVRVRVTRDENGVWELLADPLGGTDYQSQGTATDTDHNTGQYIGVYCEYTSTRSDKFFFDDFFVDPIYEDNDAPELISITNTGADEIVVTFSEPVDLATAEQTSNYIIDNGVGSPIIAMINPENPSQVILTFENDFPINETLTLTASGIGDLEGNILNTDSLTFAISQAEFKAVVINEIHHDVEPIIGLPDAEFVELYNTTNAPIDLSNWKFEDPTEGGKGTITEGAIIAANGYLILCKTTEVELWNSYGPTAGVTKFPSLNNGGDELSLKNANDVLIDKVEYDVDWHENEEKADGGYTLELLDPNYPCVGGFAWTSSTDPSGGTPGKINSQQGLPEDNTPIDLLRAEVVGNNTILLFFSESVEEASAVNNAIYNVTPNLEFQTVLEVDGNKMRVRFVEEIALGTVYNIVIDGVTDCSGNGIGLFNTTQFGKTEPAEARDIVVNEILFNPLTGGADYVELYNRSTKVIDLSQWYIGNSKEDLNWETIIDSVQISNEIYTIYPDEYVVLTEDPQWVIDSYGACENLQQKKIIEVDLPGYSDSEGTVGIVQETPSFTYIMDAVHYSDKWHHPLLDEEEGVSLERIDPEGTTQDSNNWQSAAAGSCNGTPGYQNSQFYAGAIDLTSNIQIEPKVFSPDGDGYRDFTQFFYEFDEVDYVVNITIFDDTGRKIKRLANSVTVGKSGSFKWDGTDDSGDKAPLGIYIIHTEIFDLEGNVQGLKESCVLGGNLD